MQECIQELPRRPAKTGKELPVIEQPLEEAGLPAGKGWNKQSMDKPSLDKWDKDDLGDVPEPPKPRKLEPKRHRGGHLKSERRSADEARKRENEVKMSEMSREGTPPRIHDLI